MNGFISDLKYTWNKPGSGLLRLIIVNVVVYVCMSLLLLALKLSGLVDVYYEYIFPNVALPPSAIDFVKAPWTLITYFFMHSMSDFFHILFNMLIMYWFGMIFTEFLGDKKVVAIYFLGGIAGGLAYLFMYNVIPYYNARMDMVSGLIGASASVYAIVVGSAAIAPDYKINLLFVGPVKIKYLAAVYIFLSLIQTAGANAGGEIAHLGGALMGYGYVAILKKGTDLGTPLYKISDFFSDLMSSEKKLKVVHRGGKKKASKKTTTAKTGAQPSQATVDEILDKISDKGYEGLTQEEKQILFKASQRKH
ncbi:rhomboid family intramembrane serine protease [Flammeovirga agarivorans]|uniref:Rhomboid family intramembrane serine protease n=1 Tax=Flammeovirga agarivorans TaxID=2726742 RepID=A0A7X8SJD7_9BACT|nr:rhomboid family intramembrane serine protease [Flammeovirga agarivorans]NLR91348.1 rhomboid family intramembrane serine protease [Flammeovirga agarivorans]